MCSDMNTLKSGIVVKAKKIAKSAKLVPEISINSGII